MHKLRDAPGETEAGLKSRLEDIAGKGKVYVLGLGNTDRADDGAGVLVAQALKKLFPSYSYSEHDGVEGTVLDISEKDGDIVVFFVDASELHAPPGTVRVIEKESIRETEITTHRVAVALMAAMLTKSGKRSAVIGIQPESIEFRAAVTDSVADAIDRIVRALDSVMRKRDR
jgi:hydrogenase maturation protease